MRQNTLKRIRRPKTNESNVVEGFTPEHNYNLNILVQKNRLEFPKDPESEKKIFLLTSVNAKFLSFYFERLVYSTFRSYLEKDL